MIIVGVNVMLNIFQTEKNETAKQYATRTLLHNIICLNLKPGEKLIENELCSQLGLSRTPVREAILQLNRQNMIDIYPKQGTYVSLIDTTLIDEFLAMRSLMVCEVAKLACDMFHPDDIEKLREITAVWDYYANSKNSIKMQEYDKEFHNHIYHICNKQFWCNVINNNSHQFDRILNLVQDSMPVDFLHDDHTGLIDAIEVHDKEKAYAITSKHLSRFYNFSYPIKNIYPDYFKKV